ncbi:prepilin-type N-terminal cleavage/methylation domain-containing protein [Plebeiibacterium sediminum]|uniref:Uncharacterized protein n=1 Tax=Plebeiibacterium sediminum TaxID=2992112 RepID=A0AAE3M614_9BACT|nr:prepilin-type N-terminal cleavage/methylation domain-containing protein [Plebeiobacterium sediminum]MCW3787901.1 hypothetical protein [Plebeiobacterium sediminum]
MSIINAKIKGNSLIEVIVAFVIVSLSIALTGTFLSQLLDEFNRFQKQKVWYDLNLLKNQTIKSQNTETIELIEHNYKIQKNVELVNEVKGLYLVELSAIEVTNNRIMDEKKEPLFFYRFYVEVDDQ